MPVLLAVASLARLNIHGEISPASDLTPVLRIDADRPTGTVSPALYGLMTEEINFSYEGGLYAELIRNRTFKASPTEPKFWTSVNNAIISLDTNNPLNSTLDLSLQLDARVASKNAPAGVANGGFWGIPVWPHTTYRASFYAKAADGFSGSFVLAIQSGDGKKTFAQTEISGLSSGWKKIEATLTTGEVSPSKDNNFTITTTTPGRLWLQQVSLFPPTFNNRPNGIRPDLMKLLAGLNPKFLRFPGGNYLEGKEIKNRFDWKKTIGPIEQRPGHDNDGWHYWSTDGFGLLEFLEWCEDLKMEPVLAVYAGYSMNQRVVPAGADREAFVQDALDEIEYVTGDVTTRWGAQRSKDGHPAPFPLRYIEVGNEDYADKSGSYEERFAQFYDAIREKYPHLQIISSSKVKSRAADVSDELHIYSRHQEDMDYWIQKLDNWPRTGPKLFAGEWSTMLGAPTPNMAATLGDAAWMTGLERNSDQVILSCYAPLFVNVSDTGKGGSMQVAPNLIGYDALTSYGSPSYYMLKMFSANHGDQILATAATNIPTALWQPPSAKKNGVDAPLPPKRSVRKLHFDATRDSQTGTLYLKVVNSLGTPQPVKIEITGAPVLAPDGTAIVLKGNAPEDTNSINDPEKITPTTTKVSRLGKNFTYTFAPYSVSVFIISVQ